MPDRLESLDVFRGLTIAAMILVSTPGSWSAVYPPLDHAIWHGWTPTDLVFPFLLFAMGAAIPVALSRRRGRPRGVAPHVMRRATLLFLLGLLLNAIETPAPLALETFRIPGVLQRVAIVYAVTAALSDSTMLRTQAAAAIAALAVYWGLMTLVPVPGVGTGVLTPEGNLASFIDRAVLGRHLLTPLYDPEGILSTLPAVATALAGVFAGVWLLTPDVPTPQRTIRLWAAGFAAMAAGFAWGRVFPFNKNLWTSSFAVFSAGLAAQTLAVCHGLVETVGSRTWTRPLAAYGRNTLAAYFLSVGLDAGLTRWRVNDGSLKGVLYRVGFASWLQPCCGAEAASLAYALAYVALWGALLFAMHRRRIFIEL